MLLTINKKLFVLLLIVAPVTVFAQFKVNSNSGNCLVGSSSDPLYYNSTAIKFEVNSPLTGSSDNIGLQSTARMTGSSALGKAIGVLGVASNGYSGRNFGVMGYLGGQNYGAAVYGTIYSNLNLTLSGHYAGLFYGDVRVEGTLTASSVVNTSDIRLKENIVSVRDKEGSERFLDRVLSLDVLEYNLKDRTKELFESTDSMDEKVIDNIARETAKRHIGVSAQELQKYFPNLVEEGKDGYLAVNYVELVPVLIRAIQELNQELCELKGEGSVVNARVSATDITEVAGTGNKLYQNTPNPFKEQTTIRFQLADDAVNAYICIFDMTGKQLKKMPVSSGMDSITVNGYDLGEGMFLYSLVVNGQEIDTKRMILSK